MTATLTTPDAPEAPAPPTATGSRSRGELGALAALLAGTGLLYLWNLGASGYANSFYAAAVQAGTKNWEALLFGSLDTGNIITVDKPPASLWVMSLSGRIFGFNSWSMLVPEALMGVATVALIYAAVRRVAGPRAGLLAGAAMALTPVAVLMFRFNNPDALLVLLMVAAAYATVRAVENAGTRWLVLAGTLIGFAFLAKLGQALIVVPGLALAYLVAAPTGVWHRIRQLLYAGVAIVVSAGWYIALTDLWPADSRPYIGGSVGNSLLQLALGYNGLGRIFGGSGDPGGGGGAPGGGFPAGGLPGGGFPGGAGGPGGGGFGGQAGIGRLFASEIGGQVAWLLPAALALLVAGLWITRRAPRVDRPRASLILWGGWTLVTAVVFSFAVGIFHSYYTVALAPGIAALVGIGGHELWKHRTSWPGRAALAVVVAGTAVWAWVLLGRSAEFLPWLRWVVLVVAAVAVVALLVPAGGRRLAGAAAAAVVITGVAGPAAYAVDTAAVPHTGSIPSAGPSTGGGGFPRGGQASDRRDGSRAGAGAARQGGGPGEEEATDPALDALLQSAGTKWSAATVGAMGGAGLALSSGTNVMTIGGFMGSDPAPTLAQFQAYVAAGDVHWFVEGGGFGGAPNIDRLPQSVRDDPRVEQFLQGGRGRGDSEITTWVQEHYTSTTVGGRTVYDLTTPKQGIS